MVISCNVIFPDVGSRLARDRCVFRPEWSSFCATALPAEARDALRAARANVRRLRYGELLSTALEALSDRPSQPHEAGVAVSLQSALHFLFRPGYPMAKMASGSFHSSDELLERCTVPSGST